MPYWIVFNAARNESPMKRKRNNDERLLGVNAPDRAGISLAEILNPESGERGARSHVPADRQQETQRFFEGVWREYIDKLTAELASGDRGARSHVPADRQQDAQRFFEGIRREYIDKLNSAPAELAKRQAERDSQDRARHTLSQNDAAMALNRLSVLDGLAARPDGMHWAAWNGLANVVDCQLRSGADPNWADQHGNTALHLAAGMGFVKVVDLLLMAGADPRAANLKGATALVLAAERGHREVVDRLQGALRSTPAPRYARPPALPQGRGAH
jgi:hypothetical protein